MAFEYGVHPGKSQNLERRLFMTSRQRGRYRIQTGLSTARLLWNLNLLVPVKINCMQILQNITGRCCRSKAFEKSVENYLKTP